MQINFITLIIQKRNVLFKELTILDHNWNKRKINFTIDRIELKFSINIDISIMDWNN